MPRFLVIRELETIIKAKTKEETEALSKDMTDREFDVVEIFVERLR